jgi:hypothetical protein
MGNVLQKTFSKITSHQNTLVKREKQPAKKMDKTTQTFVFLFNTGEINTYCQLTY